MLDSYLPSCSDSCHILQSRLNRCCVHYTGSLKHTVGPVSLKTLYEPYNRVVYIAFNQLNDDSITSEQFHSLNDVLIITQIKVSITHLDSPQSTTDWLDIYWGLSSGDWFDWQVLRLRPPHIDQSLCCWGRYTTHTMGLTDSLYRSEGPSIEWL